MEAAQAQRAHSHRSGQVPRAQARLQRVNLLILQPQQLLQLARLCLQDLQTGQHQPEAQRYGEIMTEV